jgi:transposase
MTQNLRPVGLARAKTGCHLVGLDARGKRIVRKRLRRGEGLAFMATLPPVTVGMEACGGAPHWARRLRAQGHEGQLMAPQYVRPSVKTNTNNLHDAAAIAAAVPRPSRRFGPITTVAPHDGHAWPRVRERLLGARTALMNARRGLFAAYGVVWPVGITAWRNTCVETLDAEQATLTPLRAALFRTLGQEWKQFDTAITAYEDTLHGRATTHPEAQRLRTIPELGPLTATALLAAVSDGRVCSNGCQGAAGLGLAPTGAAWCVAGECATPALGPLAPAGGPGS